MFNSSLNSQKESYAAPFIEVNAWSFRPNIKACCDRRVVFV
jgi:hypothetical protein